MATTWNAADAGPNIVISGGGLVATNSSASLTTEGVRGTTGKASNKWYFEATFSNGEGFLSSGGIGVADTDYPINPASFSHEVMYRDDGRIAMNGETALKQDYTVGDVLGLAIDVDNYLFWCKNITAAGDWNNDPSADPTTGVGGYPFGPAGASLPFSITGGKVYPAAYLKAQNEAYTANFGGTAFSGSVPSGFTAWDSVPSAQFPHSQVSITG